LGTGIHGERGDEPDGAFEKFFHADFPAVVALLLAAGFGRDDALDAAADAMTQAYEKWSTITSPGRWVRKTAIRIAIAMAARQREATRRAIRGGWLARTSQEDDRLAAVEHRQPLLQILDQLPPQQRMMTALRVDGYEPAEIAELLGTSPETVRSHLRHARRRIEGILDEGGEGR